MVRRSPWRGPIPVLAGAALVLGAALFLGGEAAAYRHHRSGIRYLEYSQAAFDRAKRENKPVFVLLSAVWCYWCKVYEEKTLETEPVVKYLNRNFVNVFVDLDRRQDLQHLFVKKGIPTSVIFTPQGREFISFSGILNQEEFLSGIRQVVAAIGEQSRPTPTGEAPPTVRDVAPYLQPGPALVLKAGDLPAGDLPAGTAPFAEAAEQARRDFLALVLENYDMEQAGFGMREKYPQGALLQYLLGQAHRTGNGPLRASVLATLNRIARHLYDPVEGGFYRYAERRDWSVVHHEKLLPGNMALLRAYQLATRRAPPLQAPMQPLVESARYGEIRRTSLAFVLRIFHPQGRGGFFASLDGKHPRYYRLDAEKRARAQRPVLDRTLYTAWNGEAIFWLTEMQRDRPDPKLRKAIAAALDFLREDMLPPSGGMYGYYREDGGGAAMQGQLKDNAWAALAFISGYALTGKAAYSESFERIFAFARERLYMPETGAFRLWNVPARGSNGGAGLRAGEQVSAEVPLRENGVMALALARAYRLTGSLEYGEMAGRMAASFMTLDPYLFDEDPNDPGKTYLAHFIYFLMAIDELTRSQAQPRS